MPDALFGKSLREVYVNLLIGSESEDWDQFIRLLNVSSAHELRNRIETAFTMLKECDTSNSLSDFTTSLILFSEELKHLGETQKTDAAATSPKSQNVFVPQGKKLDKFELKAVRGILFLFFFTLANFISHSNCWLHQSKLVLPQNSTKSSPTSLPG